MALRKTSERGDPTRFESLQDFLTHVRHLYAYEYAKSLLSKDARVVEIGCGEGYGSAILATACETLLAFDVDAETIRHASTKYSTGKSEFRLYDGRHLPLVDGQIDVVVSFQVIEHIEDDSQFVAEACRLLKAGGLFLVSTPNRLHRLHPGQRPWNTYHVREYDAGGLATVLGREFSEVIVRGIEGNEAIQAIELDRVRRIRRLVSLDPFNLRRRLPMSLIRRIADFSRKTMFGGSSEAIPELVTQWKQRYDVSDFHVEDAPRPATLDLIAVCRK